jgi:hypothetical protein
MGVLAAGRLQSLRHALFFFFKYLIQLGLAVAATASQWSPLQHHLLQSDMLVPARFPKK